VNKCVSIGLLLAVATSSSACGYLNRQIPNLGLPEYDLSSTEVGVATGAVLGGGVGAIIGSVGGNAGEGLVIGALTGATAGGVVGNEFDKTGGGYSNQEEILIQQREEIRRQKDEIEELRFQRGDVASANINSGDSAFLLGFVLKCRAIAALLFLVS